MRVYGLSKFKDSRGREWSVIIDSKTIATVRAFCGIDVTIFASGTEDSVRLANDDELFALTLYGVCYSQAQYEEISIDDFKRLLYGDVGDATISATIALIEAIQEYEHSGENK